MHVSERNMFKRKKVLLLACAVLALGVAGYFAIRGSASGGRNDAQLLAGMTLTQITDRIATCGKFGKATHEKIKSGQASDSEKATFEDCRRFVVAAKNYFSGGGAIILDANNGTVRAPQ